MKGHGGGNSGPTFRKGEAVDHRANGFDPQEILRDFDYGKTTRMASGRILREWSELGYRDTVMDKIMHGNAERVLGL